MTGEIIDQQRIAEQLLFPALAAAAKRPEVQDTTVYGAGRASPRTFYRHHLAAIYLLRHSAR